MGKKIHSWKREKVNSMKGKKTRKYSGDNQRVTLFLNTIRNGRCCSIVLAATGCLVYYDLHNNVSARKCFFFPPSFGFWTKSTRPERKSKVVHGNQVKIVEQRAAFKKRLQLLLDFQTKENRLIFPGVKVHTGEKKGSVLNFVLCLHDSRLTCEN